MEKLTLNFTLKFRDEYTHLQQRGPITIHQKVLFSLGITSIFYSLWRLWKNHQTPAGIYDIIYDNR